MGAPPYPKRPRPWPAPLPPRAPEQKQKKNARHLAAQETGETRKELVMSMVDHLIERGWLVYGPYNELTITERAWPLCVAVMAALVLAVAYIEHGTVMVP